MDSYERLKAELPQIAKAVNGFTSEQVQQQAFRALLRALLGEEPRAEDDTGFSAFEVKDGDGEANAGRIAGRRSSSKGSKSTPAGGRIAARAKVAAPTLDKNLNLRPKGATSFVDFAKAKAPSNGNEKNLVAVYYLERMAGVEKVNVNQVYTSYKEAGWRVPNNPRNALQVTASSKGWINTASMEDMKVTPAGENHVEHDLPAKAKA